MTYYVNQIFVHPTAILLHSVIIEMLPIFQVSLLDFISDLNFNKLNLVGPLCVAEMDFESKSGIECQLEFDSLQSDGVFKHCNPFSCIHCASQQNVSI